MTAFGQFHIGQAPGLRNFFVACDLNSVGIQSAGGVGKIDVPALRLDHHRDRQRLHQTVERLTPRLLVLDPLVRLHGVDENAVADIALELADDGQGATPPPNAQHSRASLARVPKR